MINSTGNSKVAAKPEMSVKLPRPWGYQPWSIYSIYLYGHQSAILDCADKKSKVDNMAAKSDAAACQNPAQANTFKYFTVGTEIPIDEDQFFEFKGHRSICVEELPPSCLRPPPPPSKDDAPQDPLRCFKKGSYPGRQTRQPVSKTINAFLNSGKGGVVYLGITDDGIVGGIKLTRYQKDHIEKSLKDLMARYTPPVPKNRWNVTYILCVRQGLTPSEIEMCLNYQDFGEESLRKRNHNLRTYHTCWCDIDAEAMLSHGLMPPSYVIAITVFPWIPSERPLKVTGTKLPSVDDMKPYIKPIFENEEGVCYVRGQASVKPLTKQQIFAMAMKDVHDFFAGKGC